MRLKQHTFGFLLTKKAFTKSSSGTRIKRTKEINRISRFCSQSHQFGIESQQRICHFFFSNISIVSKIQSLNKIWIQIYGECLWSHPDHVFVSLLLRKAYMGCANPRAECLNHQQMPVLSRHSHGSIMCLFILGKFRKHVVNLETSSLETSPITRPTSLACDSYLMWKLILPLAMDF